MSRRPCSVDDCERPVVGKGLCNMHYIRARKHGSTDVPPPSRTHPANPKAPCSVAGCGRPSRARALCDMHWQRWMKKGDLGGSVSLKRNRIEYFWDFVDKNGPVPVHCPELGCCWVWVGYGTGCGYGLVSNQNKHIGAHRVSWELEHGPITDGLWVLHRCDNPSCVRPSHLFLGTQSENMEDCFAKGRRKTALTEEQVVEIIALLGSGRSRLSLSHDFGVSPTAVNDIASGKTWKRLPR